MIELAFPFFLLITELRYSTDHHLNAISTFTRLAHPLMHQYLMARHNINGGHKNTAHYIYIRIHIHMSVGEEKRRDFLLNDLYLCLFLFVHKIKEIGYAWKDGGKFSQLVWSRTLNETSLLTESES